MVKISRKKNRNEKKLNYLLFCAEDTPSQQQAALKQKQNSQQPATENDQNAAAIGATSQSPIGSANPQQSQNSLNNSQQHQMVSRLLNIDIMP